VDTHPGIRSGGATPTVSSLKASINVRRARYALMMSLSRSERLVVVHSVVESAAVEARRRVRLNEGQ
jgi:hypothetical protein